MQIQPIENWLHDVKKPLVISGPCSAESEEQVLKTAALLAETGSVNVFRAGIWKPRTRPNTFEGIGEEGLVWLQKVRELYGFKIAVEVANSSHVEACLKHGVDILWIGARTAANPFSVQEIADAIKGTDIPVMVKNPINPDLQLWIGALERINQAGITKLAAIHRGFSLHEMSPYRNVPKWEIPIELKRLYPDLQIICDPSHIAGKRDLIPHLAQKAMDLDMFGLMIEAHCDPDNAWSDKAQQLTPEALKTLLDNLVIRETASPDPEFKDQLTILRQQIDLLDDDIMEKLGKRMEIAAQIGAYKKANNVTVLQVSRWQEILSKRIAQGEGLKLRDAFVKKFLEIIHEESIRNQTNITSR
tara:strand:- start:18585 stop:19661 length:1077 start_codon:yes stop_codon:yes gene_type:complete